MSRKVRDRLSWPLVYRWGVIRLPVLGWRKVRVDYLPNGALVMNLNSWKRRWQWPLYWRQSPRIIRFRKGGTP